MIIDGSIKPIIDLAAEICGEKVGEHDLMVQPFGNFSLGRGFVNRKLF